MSIPLATFQTSNTLRGNFMELLSQVETTIPIPNLFIVKFDIPVVLVDEMHDLLGESPRDGRTNINSVVKLFKNRNISENAGFALCNGIKVNTEGINVDTAGNQVNGYLPITYNKSRDFDPSSLSLQFMENVISISDLIFKPWVRMVSREGGFAGTLLHTDIDILYLERHNSGSFEVDRRPKIRKQYTFYNCLPYYVDADGIQTYADTPQLINKEIKWTFNRYDIKIPI